MWFLFGEVSSSSGAWDGLRYFIVANAGLLNEKEQIILLSNCHKTYLRYFQTLERLYLLSPIVPDNDH